MPAEDRPPEEQLLELFRAAFTHAKRWWALGTSAELAALACSVAAIFTLGVVTAILMIAVLTLLGVSVWMKLNRRALIALGERLRTRHLLAVGLGDPLTAHDLHDVLGEVPPAVRKRAERAAPRSRLYYDVMAPAGPERLAEMLHESVFFSREMARYAARYYAAWLSALGLVFVLILAAYSVIPEGAQFSAPFYQVLQASVAVVVSLGVLDAALTYRELEVPLRDLSRRLWDARHAGVTSEVQVVGMAWEYAVVQAHGQLVPDRLFNAHHAAIQVDWDRYTRGLSRHHADQA